MSHKQKIQRLLKERRWKGGDQNRMEVDRCAPPSVALPAPAGLHVPR